MKNASVEHDNGHLGYLLTAYLFDNLSAAGKREVESHLVSCAECRAELELLRRTLGAAEKAFDDGGKEYVFEERRRQRVMEAARRPRQGLFTGRWKITAVAALLMVAVLVGLLLPTLMRSRMAANAPESAAACKSFADAEEIYHRTDVNADGLQEYAKEAAPSKPARQSVLTGVAGAVDEARTAAIKLRRSRNYETKAEAPADKGVGLGYGLSATPTTPGARPAPPPTEEPAFSIEDRGRRDPMTSGRKPAVVAAPAPVPDAAPAAPPPATGDAAVEKEPLSKPLVPLIVDLPKPVFEGGPRSIKGLAGNAPKTPAQPAAAVEAEFGAKAAGDHAIGEIREKTRPLDALGKPATRQGDLQVEGKYLAGPGDKAAEVPGVITNTVLPPKYDGQIALAPNATRLATELGRKAAEKAPAPPPAGGTVSVQEDNDTFSIRPPEKKKEAAEGLMRDMDAYIRTTDGDLDTATTKGNGREQAKEAGTTNYAIAAKDDTIRRQEERLRQELGETEKLAEQNQALAGQNKAPGEKDQRLARIKELLQHGKLTDEQASMLRYSLRKYNTLEAEGKRDTAGTLNVNADDLKKVRDAARDKELQAATEVPSTKNEKDAARFGLNVADAAGKLNVNAGDKLAKQLDKLSEKLGQPLADPTSREAADIVVPPDILAQAELGDRWETVNPDRPTSESATARDARGGGQEGRSIEELVGVGGGATPGTGAGWGGGGRAGGGAVLKRRENLQESVELRVYDVCDITKTVADFPGPRIDTGKPVADEKPAGPTAADVIKAVKERLGASFDPALGTSIEERAGKLVVMNRPEVHEKVKEVLKELRGGGEKMDMPHSDYLVYPSNWHEIAQRSDAQPEEPRVKELRQKLSRHVSFEFVDKPLEDAIKVINDATGANITLDPQLLAEGAGKKPITLRVQDMEAELALRWLTRLADLDLDFGGGPVAVGTSAARPHSSVSANEITLRGYSYFRTENEKLTLRDYLRRPAPVPPAVLTDDGLDEDLYIERHGTRPFVDCARDNLSTFGMDVDTASYTRSRQSLREGKLPDADTVRVEEFLNYFKQPYTVAGDDAFGVFVEGAPSPFGTAGVSPASTYAGGTPAVQLLKIGIKSRDPRPNERKPAMLTLVVDTSGSMETESRLDMVRGALKALVQELAPDDAVTLVSFSDQAELRLPRTQARQKQRILDAIDSLDPHGATNVEAGLALAYRIADECYSADAVNRVILCSDGMANVGAKDADEVLKLVKVFAGRGVDLSTVGFGGSQYNDQMMAKLADNGNGSCQFVDSLDEARKIFREQLPPHLNVLARDAKVQVEFNPEAVERYRLLGYEKRKIADKDFRNDKIDAGEVAHSTLVTAMYEIVRKPGSHGALGKVYLRWKDAAYRHLPVVERNYPLSEGVMSGDVRSASPEFRFLACVARFAELLRGSPWVRDSSYAAVLGRLDELPPDFKGRPEWQEVRELVSRAQALSVKQWLKEAR